MKITSTSFTSGEYVLYTHKDLCVRRMVWEKGIACVWEGVFFEGNIT